MFEPEKKGSETEIQVIGNSTEIEDFDKISPKALTPKQVDQLINDLIEKTQECVDIMEGIETSEDIDPFFKINFISLSNAFAGGLKAGDMNDPKMNLGYIVSTAMALNTSNDMKKLVDSIGKYIDDCNLYCYYSVGYIWL